MNEFIKKIKAFRSNLAVVADLLYPGTLRMHFVPETRLPPRSRLALVWDSLFPGITNQATSFIDDVEALADQGASEAEAFVQWIRPLTQRLRSDIHAVKTSDGPSCRRSPLPAALLKAHFAGGAQVGLYTMAKGADTTRVALFDLDSHQGATAWPEMVEVVGRLSARAAQRGLKAHAFRSSGGRGAHLIFIWLEPQHAYSVRRLLGEVLQAEGLAVGTGGVVTSQVEVFPKQDVCLDCGHMFILPLGGKSLPLELSDEGDVVVSRRAVLESGWKWCASDPVPMLERPAPRAVSVDNLTVDLQMLKSYCDLIPNEGERELPYEEGEQGRSYLQLMMAVHRGSAGSDEGLGIAAEMFDRSAKFKAEDLEYRWPTITPRENGITVRTLINAAKFYAPEAAHAIEMKSVEDGFDALDAPPEDQPAKKSFLGGIDSMRVGSFLDAPPPPRRYLLANFLPAATVALAGAAGGTGKSQFSIQAGLCLATGDKLADHWEVREKGASLLLCSEDESEELHRRVHNTFEQMTAGEDAEAKRVKRAAIVNNFFVTSLVGDDVRLLKQEQRGGWSINTARVQEIIAAAQQIPDLKLIVLDPASRFRGGDENDSDGATRFIEVLERIRAATGATVLVTAHVNKTSIKDDDPSNTAFRGASGLTDGARMTFMMSTLTEAAARKKGIPVADRWKYVRVDTGKFNYGPPVREVWLKKGVGGFLHRLGNEEFEPERGASKAFSENELRAAIVNLVRDRAAQEKYYSPKGFRDTFGGADKMLGVSDRRLREILPAMINDGQLREVAHPAPRGGVRTALLTGETPVSTDDSDALA